MAALRQESLQPAIRRPAQLHFVLWYPYKTQVRATPEFKDIVRELGLVDYWRKTGNWGDFCKPVGSDDFECR